MKIVVPTLRQKRNGVILADELEKSLKKTCDAELIFVDDKDKKWND